MSLEKQANEGPLSESKFGIVFFDGVCGLCNKSVDWLLWVDTRKRLRFAALQGEFVRNLPGNLLKDSAQDLDTIVFFVDGKIFTRSEAVIRIFEHLGGFWKIARVFRLCPRFFRDRVYKIIARYRYKLFGEKDFCRVPTGDEKKFFI